MNDTTEKDVSRRPKSPDAASACYRIPKMDKYSWIGLFAAIAILLLAWWARSSH